MNLINIKSMFTGSGRTGQAGAGVSVPQLPALSAPVDANDPVEQARKQFRSARLIDTFRTVALIQPHLPDTQHYREYRASHSSKAEWLVYTIARQPDMTREESYVMILGKPHAVRKNFIEAMEDAALYEWAEKQRGAIPVQRPEDLGTEHYIAAGRIEGLVFNRKDYPRPTLNGRIVVPDDYAEDAFNAVVPRPHFQALQADITNYVLQDILSVARPQVDTKTCVTPFHEQNVAIENLEKDIANFKVISIGQDRLKKDYQDYLESPRKSFSFRSWGEKFQKQIIVVAGRHYLETKDLSAYEFSQIKDFMQAQCVYYLAARIQGGRIHGEYGVPEEFGAKLVQERSKRLIDSWESEREKKQNPDFRRDPYDALLLLSERDEPLPLMPGHDEMSDMLNQHIDALSLRLETAQAGRLSDLVKRYGPKPA